MKFIHYWMFNCSILRWWTSWYAKFDSAYRIILFDSNILKSIICSRNRYLIGNAGRIAVDKQCTPKERDRTRMCIIKNHTRTVSPRKYELVRMSPFFVVKYTFAAAAHPSLSNLCAWWITFVDWTCIQLISCRKINEQKIQWQIY